MFWKFEIVFKYKVEGDGCWGVRKNLITSVSELSQGTEEGDPEVESKAWHSFSPEGAHSPRQRFMLL